MLAVPAGGSAWLAVTFSIYAGYFLPPSATAAKALSIALLAALSAINLYAFKDIASGPAFP